MKHVSACVLFFITILNASFVADVSVRFDEGTYYFTADFTVEATPQRVMEVLTDYENIHELNPVITESDLLETSQSDITRIRTVLRDCVLFFCRTITRVEDVAQINNERLEAYLIPMMSDLRSGEAVWVLNEIPTGTTVNYEANMQPKFWIPPFIRSYVLTKKFKNRVLESIERLQKVATS